MQSVATGQVLGKLHTEYRELDLDNAAEMSVKEPCSLENSEMRGLGWLLTCRWAPRPEKLAAGEL